MAQNNGNLVRRNIFFQSLDSGIFMSGIVFFNQMTIMIVFIQQLYDSALIVSLVPALFMIGYNIPGLFTTGFAERSAFRKKFIALGGFIQRLFVLCMVLSVFLLPFVGPRATALIVLFFYLGFSFMGGVYNPAWIDFCAKTIPVNYRARTNAARSLIGGLGGIAAPLLIDYLLNNFSFPGNYQLTIFCGFLLLFLSFSAFLMIRETEPSPPVAHKSFGKFLRSLGEVLKKDRNFVRFLLTQILLSVSECGAAFYAFFATKYLFVRTAWVVWYTLWYNVGFGLSGIALGFIGDKLGNLNVLRIGAFGCFLGLLLVILFPNPATISIVFIIVGINYNARLNSFQVFITEFGDDQSRIRYSALATSIGASAFGLMPLVGGILLDVFHVDFVALFVVGAVCALLAFVSYLFFVKDPRSYKAPVHNA
ncbi:MAG: MFS transporter [Spirochaetales bacterium]|nr:MFS transporter [Spirochaetales bacterium]